MNTDAEKAESSTLTKTPKVVETKEVEVEEPTEEVAKTSGSSEPTPGELVGLGRPPYLVDLLQARPAYETFDVKAQTALVDEFLREGIEDTRSAYQNALSGLRRQIKETGDIYTDLAQMKEYVELQMKIRGVLKEKEEFEAKDPLEMSTRELKRFFKGKLNHV
jgi:hypothetical protein